MDKSFWILSKTSRIHKVLSLIFKRSFTHARRLPFIINYFYINLDGHPFLLFLKCEVRAFYSDPPSFLVPGALPVSPKTSCGCQTWGRPWQEDIITMLTHCLAPYLDTCWSFPIFQSCGFPLVSFSDLGVRVEPHMQELSVAESTRNPMVSKHALLPLLGSRSTGPNVLLDWNCPREPEDLSQGTAVMVCGLFHLKLVMQWFLLEKT